MIKHIKPSVLIQYWCWQRCKISISNMLIHTLKLLNSVMKNKTENVMLYKKAPFNWFENKCLHVRMRYVFIRLTMQNLNIFFEIEKIAKSLPAICLIHLLTRRRRTLAANLRQLLSY